MSLVNKVERFLQSSVVHVSGCRVCDPSSVFSDYLVHQGAQAVCGGRVLERHHCSAGQLHQDHGRRWEMLGYYVPHGTQTREHHVALVQQQSSIVQ